MVDCVHTCIVCIVLTEKKMKSLLKVGLSKSALIGTVQVRKVRNVAIHCREISVLNQLQTITLWNIL